MNIGAIDRLLRFGAGLALITMTLTGTIGWWGLIGVIPLATAAVRYCPAYQILGLKTCPMAKS